jgi:hypothetical protein
VNRVRRVASIPAGLRAMALQGRQSLDVVGTALPASPPGVLPPSGIGQAPRLPSQPIAPFIPNTPPLVLPQQPPLIGSAGTYESTRKDVTLPDAAGGNQQIDVYTTQQRWRGIDVYLSVPNLPALLGPGKTIGIQVYAIVQGVSTLVAMGRFSNADAVQGNFLKHMIAYRGAIAEVFDVRLSTNFFGPNAAVQVAIIGSDEAVPASDHPHRARVGLIPMTANGLMWVGNSDLFVSDAVPFQVAAIDYATNDVAEPVYFQLHDVAAGPPPLGQAPVWQTMIVLGGFSASGTTSAGEETGIGYHSYVNGLFAGFSNTPLSFVAAAGGNHAGQVYFR